MFIFGPGVLESHELSVPPIIEHSDLNWWLSDGKMGRPSSYTEEIAAEICERLIDGESLSAICRDAHMPSKGAVLWWVEEDREGFSDRYARARNLQAIGIADELLDIADDGRNDWMQRMGRNGIGWELNGEHIQRSRARIDTRKWLLSKMLPKVYGDTKDDSADRDLNIRITGGLPDE